MSNVLQAPSIASVAPSATSRDGAHFSELLDSSLGEIAKLLRLQLRSEDRGDANATSSLAVRSPGLSLQVTVAASLRQTAVHVAGAGRDGPIQLTFGDDRIRGRPRALAATDRSGARVAVRATAWDAAVWQRTHPSPTQPPSAPPPSAPPREACAGSGWVPLGNELNTSVLELHMLEGDEAEVTPYSVSQPSAPMGGGSPCTKDVECHGDVRGNRCEEGACVCATGWTGASCEREVSCTMVASLDDRVGACLLSYHSSSRSEGLADIDCQCDVLGSLALQVSPLRLALLAPSPHFSKPTFPPFPT